MNKRHLPALDGVLCEGLRAYRATVEWAPSPERPELTRLWEDLNLPMNFSETKVFVEALNIYDIADKLREHDLPARAEDVGDWVLLRLAVHVRSNPRLKHLIIEHRAPRDNMLPGELPEVVEYLSRWLTPLGVRVTNNLLANNVPLISGRGLSPYSTHG